MWGWPGALRVSSTRESVSWDFIGALPLFLTTCEGSVGSFLNPMCFPTLLPCYSGDRSWVHLLSKMKRCLVPCAVVVGPECLPLFVVSLAWWLPLSACVDNRDAAPGEPQESEQPQKYQKDFKVLIGCAPPWDSLTRRG